MNVTVDIHNTDLGSRREITDVGEQVQLLCTAIAHADHGEGAGLRALTRLAHVLAEGDAVVGARLLLSAAAIAAHGIGLDIDEAIETVEDNMEALAAEPPRTS